MTKAVLVFGTFGDTEVTVMRFESVSECKEAVDTLFKANKVLGFDRFENIMWNKYNEEE